MKVNILKLILLSLLIGIILEGGTVIRIGSRRLSIYPSFTISIMFILTITIIILEAYQMYKKYKEPINVFPQNHPIYYNQG